MTGSSSSCMEWLGGATPLAIAVSIVVAIAAIRFARKNAKQQKSIDMLFSLKRDDKFVSNIQELRRWRKHTTEEEREKIGKLMGSDIEKIPEEDKELLSRARTIIYILNCFEDISIGIKHGIFDERIIENSITSTLVEIWDATKRSIQELRKVEGNKAYFEEFEALAKRWQKKRKTRLH